MRIDQRLTSARLSGDCIRCHPYTQELAMMTGENEVRVSAASHVGISM